MSPPGNDERRPAGAASSVEVRGDDQVSLALRGLQHVAIRDHVAECKARRARVLRHPDLAAQLTWAPMKYTDPAKWTGYVPPAFTDGSNTHRNDNPVRAQLVEIAAEAYRREVGAR